MAAYATTAAAVAGGWSYNGPIITTGIGYNNAATSQTAWWGEKPVQCGGKLLASGADTTALLASINEVERVQSMWADNKGPEDTDFPGHV